MTFHWAPEDEFEEGIVESPFGLTGAEIELAVRAEAAKRRDVVEMRKDATNGRIEAG